MKHAVATAALVCIAITACGPFHRVGEGRVLVSPNHVASQGRVASQSRTSPTPTSYPTPSPLTAGPCQIPIADISEAYGWFVSYPSGRQVPAPNSQVALPGNQPSQIGLNPGLSFDRPARKWLPVPFTWVTPNGQSYVYEVSGTAIYVVDVATGIRSQLPRGGWLFGVSDKGAFAASPTGAWFLPLDGSAAQLIAPGQFWSNYQDGAIWTLSNGSNGAVIRRDVATGAQKTYGQFKGWSMISGFDAENDPILITSPTIPSSNPQQMYSLIAVHPDGHITPVASVPGYEPTGYAVGDVHGVWFELQQASGITGGAQSGLYLSKPGAAIRRISSIEGNISGPCA